MINSYNRIKAPNGPQYQAVLETAFWEFLTQKGVSRKTMRVHCGDLTHFISWTLLAIKSNQISAPTSHHDFLHHITPELLSNYKKYLERSNNPHNIILRRISTIRMFMRCCITHGWIDTNPADALVDIQDSENSVPSIDEMLEQFSEDLARKGMSKATIRNYVSDARKFLHWVSRTDKKIDHSRDPKP